MALRTPLYTKHLEANAKIVDFGGWDMPINYGSQLEEHHQVRNQAGMFDVSHMTVVDLTGSEAKEFLRKLLANDVNKLAVTGKALYSAMLNEEGMVLDDLIVYLVEDGYRLVVNCATRAKDLAWMELQSRGFEITFTEQTELAMIAIQGPQAIECVRQVVSSAKNEVIVGLKVFQGMSVENWFIARTGYTGERGLEIILPAEDAAAFWDDLLKVEVKPIGLGARDTLRLEAGMNLYGNDMDESVSPLESNMATTIAWQPQDRNFIGRQAIENTEPARELVGLTMQARGVLRSHHKVYSDGDEIGEITSGAFSPTLGHAIALARIDKNWDQGGHNICVEIRNRKLPVQVVTPPFVRNGKKVYKSIKEQDHG